MLLYGIHRLQLTGYHPLIHGCEFRMGLIALPIDRAGPVNDDMSTVYQHDPHVSSTHDTL